MMTRETTKVGYSIVGGGVARDEQSGNQEGKAVDTLVCDTRGKNR
jgi:hypothetical protein